ncbi:unnamed protein product [Echinostoma caproni]|uniref:Reverse transcriptase domain-containing protein n=1 Tax=Echinostoma caproni TaxID=27848 RepID=A0A183ALE7_9TREM|nr:unnamed protein product [Echinostoma caproni]
MQKLDYAISGRVKNVTRKRKLALSRKLHKLDDHSPINRNENWVRDLSNRVITQDEKRVLNKGLNCNVRKATNKEYLVELGQTLKSFTMLEDVKQTIRRTVETALMRKGKDNILSNGEDKAPKTLKMDKNTFILPADKGRTTVVMNKTDYIQKAEEQDTDTYRRIDTDSTAKLENKINTTLKRLEELHQITKAEHWRMRAKNSVIAQFYELPKIYWEGIALRLIVSPPGTATDKLIKELWNRLKSLIAGHELKTVPGQAKICQHPRSRNNDLV